MSDYESDTGARSYRSAVRLALVVAALLLSVTSAAGMAAPMTFRGSISPLPGSLRATMTGVSWHAGCPVGLDELRLVRARHWGFDGHFPIRRMVPVDAYGASDFGSIEADNTSAFNCRYVDGTTRWSEHSYGRAIDLNPIENPYVTSAGTTSHRASRRYLRRSPYRSGMAVGGGVAVRAFEEAGWGWGGRWSGDRDYQHFSASGR